VIYCQHKSADVISSTLNSALKSIHDWSILNLISINTDKTKFMLFRKSPQPLPPVDIFCGNDKIENVDQFKHLGLILDPQLNFKLHYKRAESKLSSVAGSVKSISKFLPQKIFNILVKAYVLPVYDYCIDIWTTQSNSDLEALQNTIHRLLYSFSSPSLFRKSSIDVKYGDGPSNFDGPSFPPTPSSIKPSPSNPGPRYHPSRHRHIYRIGSIV